MASALTKFSNRRIRHFAVLAVITIGVLLADAAASQALLQTHFLTGWGLFALVLLLALYNVRKKLSFLPLGSSASWLQFHAYAGLLSGLLFCVHIGWRIPNGMLEVGLALVFVLVFLSGVAGLVMSRAFARRLGARGNDVLYARIPRMRNQLRVETEQLILDCAGKTESTALFEFYSDRLQPYFDRPSNFWLHLILADRPLRRLQQEIRDQAPFLSESERESLDQIADIVSQKNELDFHYSHQVSLRYWLFLHVPLTYAMLVLAVAHLVLVHAFWS